jgi:hypothetical protein
MVADHWVRKSGYLLSRALEFRKSDQNEKDFIDIFYEDLVDSSMDVLERIYERYGGIDPELRKRFEIAEIKNPQGKYGKHAYGLKDFNLTKSDIDGYTKEYKRFIIKLMH